jgi:hypothetical protein
MVTRWSQKSPGLKILWIWTLGTAASNHFCHTFRSSSLVAYRIVRIDAGAGDYLLIFPQLWSAASSGCG